jgi:hypothetical protein
LTAKEILSRALDAIPVQCAIMILSGTGVPRSQQVILVNGTRVDCD